MPSWRKRLAQMAADDNPNGYTYEEAATVLAALGFGLRRGGGGGSHRSWRKSVTRDNQTSSVVIGLVQKGSGTMKAVYIKDMIAILRESCPECFVTQTDDASD